MTWVKLDFLEARLRPVEQLDKRPPWKAEGRTMQEQLSRSRDWVLIITEVRVTNLKRLSRVEKENSKQQFGWRPKKQAIFCG
jgi:hypothetical protein